MSKNLEKRLRNLTDISKDVLDSLAFIDDIDASNVKDEIIPAPFGRPNKSSNVWKEKRIMIPSQ